MSRELPVEMTAFKTQQGTLGEGPDQVRKKILPKVLRSDAPIRKDRSLVSPDREPQLSADDRAVGTATARDGYPLLSGWFQMLYIDLPLFMASHSRSQVSICLAKRALPQDLAAGASFSASLDGVGIGLTITNTRAVWKRWPASRLLSAHSKYRVDANRHKVAAAASIANAWVGCRGLSY